MTYSGMPLWYDDSREGTLLKGFGRELVESLIVQNFTLYQIDLNETEKNFYGETKQKSYKTPVVVRGRIEIMDYDAEIVGGLRRVAKGDMMAFVYNDHLTELGIAISVGDYIYYLGKYYEVWDAGVDRDSNQTKLGIDRDYFVRILASEQKKAVFEGK